MELRVRDGDTGDIEDLDRVLWQGLEVRVLDEELVGAPDLEHGLHSLHDHVVHCDVDGVEHVDLEVGHIGVFVAVEAGDAAIEAEGPVDVAEPDVDVVLGQQGDSVNVHALEILKSKPATMRWKKIIIRSL